MGLADQIEAGFPTGARMPADLRRLCDYAERSGDPQIGYHELRPGGDALRAWFHGDETAAGKFAAFGAGPPGSVLAFWLYAGPDAAAAPVVHLGPHDLHYTLLAADVQAFLYLLGVGYGELGFDDLTIPPAELWLPPPPPDQLRAWLRAEFGITPPFTGTELVREARARHPDLGAWVRDWQRQALPEPPAERYRRELRDLMVAGIDFDRLRASPPTRASELRGDLLRVAEHVSDADLRIRIPPEGAARAAAAEVADDILGCVERGEWDRLRPTEWAVRVRYAWWYRMSWLGRAWHRLWSRERPPKLRAAGAAELDRLASRG
jgi:hypothetical protein